MVDPEAKQEQDADRAEDQARDGAKEPAPGEANPLAEHEPGERDRRTSVWGSERGLDDGWSDTS